MTELNNKYDKPDKNENGEEGKNINSSSLKNIHPVISPISAAFLGLIGGFFLYQIVGGLLTILIFGSNVEHASIIGLRLMTMAGQILFILLPALLFAKWVYHDITKIIRFRLAPFNEILLFVLGIIILTPLLQYYIAIQTFAIDHLAQSYSLINSLKILLDKLNSFVDKTYINLLTAHSVFEGILVIIVVSIVPAICEEVMFRGYIQRSFEFKMKPVWAALLTAIFFGLYHFNPYGLIPLIGLGFYFGYAAIKSDSIVVPMSLHFLNNFVAIILFFIYGNKDILNTHPSQVGSLESSIIMFFILLVLFIGVIFLIRNYYKQKIKIIGG